MSDAFDERIVGNAYPGRGIVAGLSADSSRVLIAYWIMGRSENSRNRIFQAGGSTLKTQAADASKVKDPSLIIYEAMLDLPPFHVVSNGDQTRTIYEGLRAGMDFRQALSGREREPDAPNYTPRISAVINLSGGDPWYLFSIIKACKADPSRSERHFFEIPCLAAGEGRCITTYAGDGIPLPSFEGEPFSMCLPATERELLERVWAGLDSDNKISLAVKGIPLAGGESSLLICNKYEAVEA